MGHLATGSGPDADAVVWTRRGYLQGLPAGCPRYLGVGAACATGASAQLFTAADPAAATTWRLTRVH